MTNKSLINFLFNSPSIKSTDMPFYSISLPEAEFKDLLNSLHKYDSPSSSPVTYSKPSTQIDSTPPTSSSQEEFEAFTKLFMYFPPLLSSIIPCANNSTSIPLISTSLLCAVKSQKKSSIPNILLLLPSSSITDLLSPTRVARLTQLKKVFW
jgi:hypothetical protein